MRCVAGRAGARPALRCARRCARPPPLTASPAPPARHRPLQHDGRRGAVRFFQVYFGGHRAAGHGQPSQEAALNGREHAAAVVAAAQQLCACSPPGTSGACKTCPCSALPAHTAWASRAGLVWRAGCRQRAARAARLPPQEAGVTGALFPLTTRMQGTACECTPQPEPWGQGARRRRLLGGARSATPSAAVGPGLQAARRLRPHAAFCAPPQCLV